MQNVFLKFLFVLSIAIFNACPLMAAPLTLGPGDHSINTDTGAVNSIVSPDWSGTAFNIDDLDIQAGATLLASGTQPLIFNVTGNATIAGTIDASGGDGEDRNDCNLDGGAGGIAGPGGYNGGTGGGTFGINGEQGDGPGGGGGGIVTGDDEDDSAGGGGAGHRYAGSSGESNRGTPGMSGSLYASLPPLIGGSGGGGGSVEDDEEVGELDPEEDDGGGGGGGGGGAVQINATGIITVTGTIDASGGSGGDTDCGNGGGGGGSGGSIELISNTAMPTVSGTLDVAGGLGGIDFDNDEYANGGDASEGRINVSYAPPQAQIPTMNEWGMILFTALLGITGIWYMKKQQEII